MEWELGILKVGIAKREKMLWGDGNIVGCEGGYMDVCVSRIVHLKGEKGEPRGWVCCGLGRKKLASQRRTRRALETW